jgi:hypothetical protein
LEQLILEGMEVLAVAAQEGMVVVREEMAQPAQI